MKSLQVASAELFAAYGIEGEKPLLLRPLGEPNISSADPRAHPQTGRPPSDGLMQIPLRQSMSPLGQ
jgi:hypothetical protein